MGPEFPLQRAVWTRGYMQTDPEFSQEGDTEAPRPGDPRRTPRPTCVVGRPDCVSDRGWGEGEEYIHL